MNVSDPIVEEVHRTRERLLARFDNDLHKLGAYLREQQRCSGHRVVSYAEIVNADTEPSALVAEDPPKL